MFMGSPKKFLSLVALFGISLDPLWDYLGYKAEEPPKVEIIEPVQLASPKVYYYLSSIIYCGADKWSVWINDKKYTKEHPPKDLNMKVFPDHIECLGLSVFTDQTVEVATKTVQNGDSRQVFDED